VDSGSDRQERGRGSTTDAGAQPSDLRPGGEGFAVLANPTRRAVLAWLAPGSASISELADTFGMSLTGMRKHVRLLEQADLVMTEKVGRVRRCRLVPDALERPSGWLHQFRTCATRASSSCNEADSIV